MRASRGGRIFDASRQDAAYLVVVLADAAFRAEVLRAARPRREAEAQAIGVRFALVVTAAIAIDAAAGAPFEPRQADAFVLAAGVEAEGVADAGAGVGAGR